MTKQREELTRAEALTILRETVTRANNPRGVLTVVMLDALRRVNKAIIVEEEADETQSHTWSSYH